MNLTPKLLPGFENSLPAGTYPTVLLMKDPLRTSHPTTSMASPSATSSQVLEDGPTPSSLPIGPKTGLCGQAPAPASLSPRRATRKVRKTKDTSGQHSMISSASADLSMCLGSRLQTLLGTAGSMEYRQTWRVKDTPAGRRYWAHTASAHPTSGSGCTGWPSPDTCAGGTGPSQADRNSMRLQDLVKNHVGWTTPNARDWKDSASPEALVRAMDGEKGSANLPRQVAAMTSGPTTNLSPAETEKRGALNPALSRWLMGYPVVWCQMALQAFRKLKQQRKSGYRDSKGMETPSCPRSPRTSSKQALKH